MVKVGVIGCGKIAQVRHLPEYEENGNALLAGLYDIHRQRAADLARTYRCAAYETCEDLLGNPEIDAVSVCAANHAHAELTVAALRAGKHVLCEKPMAMTYADCERMVLAARENGKILMVDHNQRFAKAHQKARQLLKEGAIGELLTFRTTFGHGGPETWSVDPGKDVWFFDRQKACMGAMGDLGVHKTDLIQYLTGRKIVRVMAQLGTLDKRDAAGVPIGVDDNAVCIYTLEGNVIGTMTASWTHYGMEDNSTVLCGTGGIMRIYESPDCAIRIVGRDGGEVLYRIDGIQTNDRQTNSGVIDHFVEGVETGAQPESSGESALRAMKAVFAGMESSQCGRSISIE